ncbi:MAG: UDP-N-acetyl-D-glucosamine/UDP-N-acetyl-D-galactosamine dehydrogenase [Syntrophus sp. SKADARSKE-3]|nr:UDP-N-acetyl-D-glucosamine/UDP-N-acetyl-D-galactosamine dehydrogenase [Syntrophus sp. SKADARSKE-3]
MKTLPSFSAFQKKKEKIAIVGLGYVGLPLAVYLGKHFSTVGFDTKKSRVEELKRGFDQTTEVTSKQLKESDVLFTDNPEDLSVCRLIIVAVPTPIYDSRIPDLGAVRSASKTVGRQLRQGSCVVYESTVYPGVTEEICLPILEKESGLKIGTGFTLGYSPERINPGDKVHTLETITKIVSGSDQATCSLLAQVYGTIVKAGIHEASSIRVAEAAKVIENTQRDINIALMNELAIIFDHMGIDTIEVLEAAGTKWNFLHFRPGLVGGHCIGVDPYYLTFKAESMGYHPSLILAGRRINDGMGKVVAEKTVKMLIAADTPVRNARVAVLGLTFKENVPDIRNTKVIDIVRELESYNVKVLLHDPLADAEEVTEHYNLKLMDLKDLRNVDAVIVAVAHKAYEKMGIKGIAALGRSDQVVVVDVKGMFAKAKLPKRGLHYWRL